MNPILIDLPMPILTPRLLLRPPEAGDGAELNRAVLETLTELKPWMPWAQQSPSVEESETNVREAHAKWLRREDLRISVFDRATGKFAAGSGLHRINWDVPCFEIGYWVRQSFAGKGVATETTNALTRYAFQQLKAKRVEIRCDPRNERSLAVMKRLGFEFEGLLRRNAKAADTGDSRDTLVYSRLSAEGLPELAVSWA